MENKKVEKVKRRMTYTQLILMIMSTSPGACTTVEELQEKTGLKRETIILYLHRLHERGIITRHWRYLSNRKIREYCLKYKDELIS